jgi:hypothetical protein
MLALKYIMVHSPQNDHVTTLINCYSVFSMLFLLDQNGYRNCCTVPSLYMQSGWRNSIPELLMWLLHMDSYCFLFIEVNYNYDLFHSPSKSRDKHHDKHKSSSSSAGKKRSREGSDSHDKQRKKRWAHHNLMGVCDKNAGVKKVSVLMKSCKAFICICCIL